MRDLYNLLDILHGHSMGGRQMEGEKEMEISEKEYYELKAQVRQLEEKVNEIKNKPIKDFASVVSELPISHVTIIDHRIPMFDYWKRTGCEAWNIMIRLAKLLHTSSARFYMDEAYDWGGSKEPYIRLNDTGDAPRRISEMTEEQINASVQMLNEIIPIYNKYFKQMHRKVLYDPTGKGDYEWRSVIDEEGEA